MSKKAKSFVYQKCEEKITLSSAEAALREMASYLKESGAFVARYQKNEIRVLLDAGDDMIAQCNGEVVARKSVRQSMFSDFYELTFSAREHGHDIP